MSRKERLWQELICAVVPMTVAFALYIGTLDAPFLYDDVIYVEENPQIRQITNAPQLWISPYNPRGLYRPTTSTTYLIDYFLVKLDPRGFHLTNLLLYLATILTFFWMIRKAGGARLEALLASLFFAAHPVHTEAVSWIVGRAEVLAGLFCFLGVTGWMSFRRTNNYRYLVLVCLVYFIGLGSKENVAPLPAVLFVGEALGLFDLSSVSKPGSFRPVFRGLAILSAVFAFYVFLRISTLGHFGLDENLLAFAGDSAQTRWASTLAGIGHYIQLGVFPTELRISYFKQSSLFDWRVFLSLGMIGTLSFIGFRTRRRAPRITFWLGWFALFLLPVSNLVIEIGTVLAERFLFLPSAAVCAIFSAGVVYGLSDRRKWWLRGLTGGCAIVLFCSFAVLTIDRNRDWQDPERFWRKALAQSPGSEKPYLHLGTLLWKLGQERGEPGLLDESDKILLAGLALQEGSPKRLTSDYVVIVQNLANHYRERGRLEEAIQLYERITPLVQEVPGLFLGGRSTVLVSYGVVLERAGRLEEALSAYEQAIATGEEKHLAGAMMNAGNVLRKMGDPEAAVQHFREAIRLNGTFREAYFNLAVSLFDLKLPKEAFDSLSQAKRLGIPQVDRYARERAQEIINEALAAQNYQKAQQTLEYLLTVVEETAQDAFSQGLLAERLGKPELARIHYQRVLTLDPNHTQALSAIERIR